MVYLAGKQGVIEVLDIRNLPSITRVGSLPITGHGTKLAEPMGAQTLGNYIFAAVSAWASRSTSSPAQLRLTGPQSPPPPAPRGRATARGDHPVLSRRTNPMFGSKVSLDSDLLKRCKDHAKTAGYSSVEEFIQHALESALRKARCPTRTSACSSG